MTPPYTALAVLASLSLLVTGVHSQSCPSDPPVLTNGDFETGQLAPWTADSPSDTGASKIVSPGKDSQHAVQLDIVGWGGGGLALSQVPVCPHQNYTLSFDYKVLRTSNCTLEAIADMYPDSDSRVKFPLAPGDWTSFAWPYQNHLSTEMNVYIAPSCWEKTDTGSVLVDNVKIVVGGVGEPKWPRRATAFRS